MTQETTKESKAEDKKETKRQIDDNVVFVGRKNVMSYVMAVVTQINKGQKEIHIKARGRSISTAVDVVQLLKNRFDPNTKTKDIEIDTEQVSGDKGEKINVSTIDITIVKP